MSEFAATGICVYWTLERWQIIADKYADQQKKLG